MDLQRLDHAGSAGTPLALQEGFRVLPEPLEHGGPIWLAFSHQHRLLEMVAEAEQHAHVASAGRKGAPQPGRQCGLQRLLLGKALVQAPVQILVHLQKNLKLGSVHCGAHSRRAIGVPRDLCPRQV